MILALGFNLKTTKPVTVRSLKTKEGASMDTLFYLLSANTFVNPNFTSLFSR